MMKYLLSWTNFCDNKRIILGPNAEWKKKKKELQPNVNTMQEHQRQVAEVFPLYAVKVTLTGTSTATTGL